MSSSLTDLKENYGLLSKEQFMNLLEVSRTIHSTLALDDVLERIMTQTNAILSAEASSILLMDPLDKKLHFRTTTGAKSKELKKFTLDMGEGIAGWVAEHAESVLVKDADTDERFSRQISEMISFPTKSMICVPCKMEDRVIGVIEILNKKGQKCFDEKDLLLASLLSGFAAIAINNAKSHTQTRKENSLLKSEINKKYILIGESAEMKSVFNLIQKVSKTNSTVHITGPSGTGKELVARNIHYQSERVGGAFVPVACSILTGTLLESELFGHEKGAFTGADKLKLGKFESANGGTIFLDEIGTLNHETQIKLLRVLEERQIERVGGNQLIDIDIRVISATNEDLPKLVQEGKFREDLFYRLKVICIDLPALKDRKDDISLLAHRFLDQFSKDAGQTMTRIHQEALECLLAYNWPGNVRELRNTIERAVVLGEGDVLTLEHLSEEIRKNEIDKKPKSSLALDNADKKHIEANLNQTGWNKSRAAKILNISRNRLDRKIKAFEMKAPDYL